MGYEPCFGVIFILDVRPLGVCNTGDFSCDGVVAILEAIAFSIRFFDDSTVWILLGGTGVASDIRLGEGDTVFSVLACVGALSAI